jgi:hypothetical protein
VDFGGHDWHNDHDRHDDHDCGRSNGDLDHDWRGATILDRTDDSSDGALAVSGGRLRHCGFPNVQ